MTTRAEIVAEAREWIGTSFVHQAALKGIGCDCAGLVRGVAINTGQFPADVDKSPSAQPFLRYGRNPDGRLLAACRALMDEVSFKDALPGDVLVFRVAEKDPQHLGIITGLDPLTMIHSYSRTRVMACIEQHVDAFWRARIVAVFRFRGVE